MSKFIKDREAIEIYQEALCTFMRKNKPILSTSLLNDELERHIGYIDEEIYSFDFIVDRCLKGVMSGFEK